MSCKTLAMAAFSRCRRYRYALWRQWGVGPRVMFVMLNPSMADERNDDPTIRRCVGFAKSWGFGSLAVGNLFAWRTKHPRELLLVGEPVGPRNVHWLRRLRAESDLVVAAWGNGGALRSRGRWTRAMWNDWHLLDVTKRGEPRHPLYVAAHAAPKLWRGETAR